MAQIYGTTTPADNADGTPVKKAPPPSPTPVPAPAPSWVAQVVAWLKGLFA